MMIKKNSAYHTGFHMLMTKNMKERLDVAAIETGVSRVSFVRRCLQKELDAFFAGVTKSKREATSP
jgi:hypothetical protein